MTITRKTLAETIVFEGIGLHTGVPVRVSVHPGSNGIAFRFGSARVHATPENVTDTIRSTKLGEIGTIEHLMSAFAGTEITDAEVELDAPELPSLDGSAKEYVEAIGRVGTVDLGETEIPKLYSRVFLNEDALKVAVAHGNGHWRFVYDTGSRWPNEQVFETFDVRRDYCTDIAPARTFALAEEIPKLIELGLGQGLDVSSALVLGIEGYKNAERFTDEPARHKLLDAIGDLYLSGIPPWCLSVVAERSGHRAHVKAASLMRQAMLQ